MGANSEEGSGLYFSWGNTEGHTEESGYVYSQDAYSATPAAEITGNLSLSQDAARANLGAAWRMPTADEFKELYDNCNHVWTIKNGVHGQLFISKVNGKSIFFPAVGYFNNATLVHSETDGFYWSSTYYSETIAYILVIGRLNINPQSNNYARRYGLSVRAVLDL